MAGDSLVNLTQIITCEYFPPPLFLRPGLRCLDAACDRIWSGLTWFTLPSSCQLFVWDFHQNEEISKGKKRVKTKRFSLIFIRPAAQVIDWFKSGAGGDSTHAWFKWYLSRRKQENQEPQLFVQGHQDTFTSLSKQRVISFKTSRVDI